ncbi:MAG TPA: hypothetical protein EYQ20_02245 [candidate division Zixibacteria bacterium]|nr:hypothetical protein [candidate division Zixibacteria bacterium]
MRHLSGHWIRFWGNFLSSEVYKKLPVMLVGVSVVFFNSISASFVFANPFDQSASSKPLAANPLVIWVEAEQAVATNFTDIYPATGLSGGRGLHFSTPDVDDVDRFSATFRFSTPQSGAYVLWSRRHLLYINEGTVPLINQLTRYIEMWWRIDGGAWHKPIVDPTPVNIGGAYPSAVGHLGFTRTGEADMAGKYIGWYLDDMVTLEVGEHEFEVRFHARQTTVTPLFRPYQHSFYGLLDAFAFAEPGYVPKGRIPSDFSIIPPSQPRAPKFGRIDLDATAIGDTIPNMADFNWAPSGTESDDAFLPLKPDLLRLCHLYNMAEVSIDSSGFMHFNWTRLDAAVDRIIQFGAEPYLCVGYTPSAISSMPADQPRGPVYGDPGMYPPNDFDAWEEVIYSTVYHLNVERKLGIRYWSIWNEPNNVFWQVWHILPWTTNIPILGRPLHELKKLYLYLKLYEHAARGALRADPSIMIGGPSVLCDGGPEDYVGSARLWITALAWWCKWQDVRLDFISVHLYAGSPDSSGPYTYGDLVRQIQQWTTFDENHVPEVIIDEWNAFSMEGGHDTITPYHAVWTMSALYEMMQAGVNHALYYHGGSGWPGIFRQPDNTPTPTYNMYRMLGMLEPAQIAVRSVPGDIGILASGSSGRITVLLWRFGTAARRVDLSINHEGSFEGTFLYQHFLIDEEHSNLRSPSQQADLEMIHQERLAETASGVIRISVDLPPTSLTLLQFEKAAE